MPPQKRQRSEKTQKVIGQLERTALGVNWGTHLGAACPVGVPASKIPPQVHTFMLGLKVAYDLMEGLKAQRAVDEKKDPEPRARQRQAPVPNAREAKKTTLPKRRRHTRWKGERGAPPISAPDRKKED